MDMMPLYTTPYKAQRTGWLTSMIRYVSLSKSQHLIPSNKRSKDTEKIGAVNTAYTVGAIIAGFFLGGPVADWLGRRWGMAIGCFVTIVATFIQTFSPRGQLGCFIAGRVIIGLGQGVALSMFVQHFCSSLC